MLVAEIILEKKKIFYLFKSFIIVFIKRYNLTFFNTL